MNFFYPSFLWALSLGAIPIIIYYLMRFRSLKVDWGATYVLERALQRLRKKLYLEQLILYIHLNPVRAGLVCKACDWPFSSARWYEQGQSVSVPIQWID